MQDCKASCKTSITLVPPATRDQKTQDPVTLTWQERGLEPSVWAPSPKLCKQQPHSATEKSVFCLHLSQTKGISSVFPFPLFMLPGNVFMPHDGGVVRHPLPAYRWEGRDEDPACLATPSSWGDSVGTAPPGFWGIFSKAFHFSEIPAVGLFVADGGVSSSCTDLPQGLLPLHGAQSLPYSSPMSIPGC